MSRRRYGLCRVRDLALSALVRHPDLRRQEVRTLRASWIRQHPSTGRLVVEPPQVAGARVVHLDDYASRRLLEYLEEARLWGEDAPLFPGADPSKPMTKSGVRTALLRLERYD